MFSRDVGIAGEGDSRIVCRAAGWPRRRGAGEKRRDPTSWRWGWTERRGYGVVCDLHLSFLSSAPMRGAAHETVIV